MELEVRSLDDAERAAAGAVASRALAANPTSAWVWGDDALARLRGNLDVFVDVVRTMEGPQVAALAGPHVVGVAAAAAAGHCVLASMATGDAAGGDPPPVGDPARLLAVVARWGGHDLEERHVHIGPVGVEPGLQGLGIGGRMMRELTGRLDEAGEVGWLETDKPENVVFYRRVGFEVADELDAHGLRTWWMRRDPR